MLLIEDREAKMEGAGKGTLICMMPDSPSETMLNDGRYDPEIANGLLSVA